MDRINPNATDVYAPKPAAPTAPKPAPAHAPGYAADAAGTGLAAASAASLARPASLVGPQLEGIAKKKATCPFIGSAVAQRALPVRNSEDKPLASVDDVVALGNTGGGDLGEVLKLFATGNHAKMADATGALTVPVPSGLFSLDFPGSQGSHPGHSGILQGDPLQPNSGRLSQGDLDRLLARAKNGYLKRSDVAAFIAENLRNDPHSKVFGSKATKLLFGDLGRFVKQTGPALMQKLHHRNSDDERKLAVDLTRTLGEDNLIGSAGEFGLLMAFLANSPRSKHVDGEPAVAVGDVTAMFRDHQFPEGWETWPKTSHDWVVNTTALLLEAGRDYQKSRS